MESINHTHTQQGVLHKPWEHTGLKVLSWTGLATAALALAPVVASFAPTTNAGGSALGAIASCTTGDPRGLAGHAYGLLQNIGFSESIISGGLATAGLSGGIAIGGLLLANYLDKRTKSGEFRWGSVVRWAALTTSVLIALPAILPAISMGLNFLGAWLGSAGLSGFAVDIGTIGTKSAVAGSASGISTALGAAAFAGIHALTCALPLGAAGFFLGQKEEPKKPMPLLQLPAFADGRLTPPLPMVRAAG
jgi:hypothetical protein